MWLIIIGATVLIMLGMLCGYLKRIKCPNCHSRKIYEINSTRLNSEPKFFKKTVKIKEYENKYNSKTNWGQRAVTNQYINPPSKIITKEVVVEGKRTWYMVRYKCTKCNKEFTIKTYIDTKPQID